MSSFDAPYWNLLQAVAWIYLGDRSMVERCADDSQTRETFLEEVTTPDGQRKLIEVEVGPHTLVSLLVAGEQNEATAVTSLKVAKAMLIGALGAGEIEALGLENGRGNLKRIPDSTWLDARICDEPMMVAPQDLFRPGAVKWLGVELKREDVLRLWPDPLAIALQRADARRTTLTFEQIAGRWTAEQPGSGISGESLAVDLVREAEGGAFSFRFAEGEDKPDSYDPRLDVVVWTFDQDGRPQSHAEIANWIKKASQSSGDVTGKRLVAARDLSLSLDALHQWLATAEADAFCRLRGLNPPRFLDEVLSARDAGQVRKATIKSQTDCGAWLAELMRSPKERKKVEYFREANARFGVSRRSFDIAWGSVP